MTILIQKQEDNQQVSLCEALDRILNKGAVIVADITISVADIDLVYLSLQALLASVETGRRLRGFNNSYDES
ncbi:MAG: gas vesicle protein [Candidatus Methylumidiphilus sp.]|nr:gas vesicle protein [Pseudomonadota bacterium]